MDDKRTTERKRNAGRGIVATAATALAAFGATIGVLGLAPRGPATAHADDPAATQNAVQVVAEFEPALPAQGVVRAPETTIDGAKVSAGFVTDESGRAAIVVDLTGPARGKAVVRCNVVLEKVVFEGSPMMRMMPAPRTTRLYSEALVELVGAGETRTRRIDLPEGIAARLAIDDDEGFGHGQVVIEVEDGA